MKDSRRLLSSVFNQAFYLGPEGVGMCMPVFLAFRNGQENPRSMMGSDDAAPKVGFEARFTFSATPYVSEEEQYWLDYYPVLTDTGVLVIPVMETLMQYDYCGVPGTSTLAKWYQKGEADPQVKAFLEVSNTPGGAVLGTAEVALAKLACTKTIVTFCEGMSCSGGQYISSASDYTFASSLNCMFGSIGVMISYRDYTEYYESLGIKMIDLYSVDSPLKNAEHRAAKEGDFTQYTEGILYKLDQNFMNFVKATRPGVSELALKGKTMLTQEAQENGLIDGICTFDEALAFALSKSPRKITPKQYTEMSKGSISSRIWTALGLSTEQTDATQAENEVIGQIDNLNTQVSERDTTIATHVATIAERDSTIQGLNDQIAANNTAHQTATAGLNARITELEARVPGAVVAQAATTTTDPISVEGDSPAAANAGMAQVSNLAAAAQKNRENRNKKR